MLRRTISQAFQRHPFTSREENTRLLDRWMNVDNLCTNCKSVMFVVTYYTKTSHKWQYELRKNEWSMLYLPHFWTVIEK